MNNRWNFTGREWQVGNKTYYYRARQYHPVLGRFFQPDPIGFQGGDVNLYSYVWNNPAIFSDPFGLAPFTNNSDRPIPYKPKLSNEARLAQPCETVDADAVYSPDGANNPTILKLPNNTSSEVRPDGSLAVDIGVRGYLDYYLPLGTNDRLVSRVVTPEDLDAPGNETNFPNPYTGRNWPFAKWVLHDELQSDSDGQTDGDPCE